MKVERTMFNDNGNLWPSPWEFNNYGESGIPVSDLFPHTGSCADDLAVIRSMTARFNEHAQANFYFHSGQPFNGFPSLGAWTTYGLGTESKDLPGFVVLGSGGIRSAGSTCSAMVSCRRSIRDRSSFPSATSRWPT